MGFAVPHRVGLQTPPPEPPQPRLLALDIAHRQRRRETWTQKLNRYALPEAATVRLTIEGGRRLTRLLAPTSAGRRIFGATG